MTKKIKFPQHPFDPYYFQCCGVGHIKINSWLNKKPKYKDQSGTYYYTKKELNELKEKIKNEIYT